MWSTLHAYQVLMPFALFYPCWFIKVLGSFLSLFCEIQIFCQLIIIIFICSGESKFYITLHDLTEALLGKQSLKQTYFKN